MLRRSSAAHRLRVTSVNTPFLFHPVWLAALAAISPLPTLAQQPTGVNVNSAASDTPAQPATAIDRIEVVGARQKLDAARNLLSPEIGTSVYRFSSADIANMPLGNATPLNQVLLRGPGVVGDSNGQLHVRGDHGNLQYRLNGVVIPEAISGFGQVLDTRFAQQISVLTGALPAQYGYRTAGIVEIRSKGTDLSNGGSADLTLGSRGHREASANVGGTAGDLSYFLTGSYLQNDIGIENPMASKNALHDQTRQGKGFGYFSYLMGEDSRVSLMLGNAQNKFQIPNVLGETPAFDLAGTPAPTSENLNANQRERNSFQVLSFQSALGAGTDYQVSLFRRYTDLLYQPDPVGDLVYNGVAAQVLHKNTATGLQFDLSNRLNDQHTLRAGLFLQHESGSVGNNSRVFPADADGAQTSTTPLTIADNAALSGNLVGVYLQDEWRPTKGLTVNYGLRYDKGSTVVNESQISPRVGATYDLSASTRVHAGYARYFTPPPTEKIDTTSVAKFLGTTNALPSDANTAVRSERSHYLDAGLSHQLTPRVTLGIDAYYRKVRHLQDEGQFGNALIYSAFNFAQGKIYGIEFSSSYKGEQLSAYANLTLARALGKGIESGQFNFDDVELAYTNQNWVHLDHDQTVAASAGLSYRLVDGTVVGADAIYGSGLRRGFVNAEHLPGYVQLNASVSRSFTAGPFGTFDARLAVLNLSDRSYGLRDGSGIGVGAPQFGPRRTVYLTLSKPFTF